MNLGDWRGIPLTECSLAMGMFIHCGFILSLGFYHNFIYLSRLLWFSCYFTSFYIGLVKRLKKKKKSRLKKYILYYNFGGKICFTKPRLWIFVLVAPKIPVTSLCAHLEMRSERTRSFTPFRHLEHWSSVPFGCSSSSKDKVLESNMSGCIRKGNNLSTSCWLCFNFAQIMWAGLALPSAANENHETSA